MTEVVVILPIFNERAIVDSVIDRIEDHLRTRSDRRFVLVDDGSSDGTPAAIVARLEAREDDRVRLVRHRTNQGKAEAIITGLRHSTAPLVCFTDGDLAYSLDHLDRLVDALAGADVAIGSRAMSELNGGCISWRRRLSGEAFNRLVRIILGVPHRDTQAGLKGFTRAAANHLFGRLRTRNFAFDAELLYIARKDGLRVREVPAHVSAKHSYETSSISLLRDPLLMLWAILKVRVRYAGRPIPRPHTILEVKISNPTASLDEVVGAPATKNPS
ncbi:MAG: glycosyltransferase, partial [Planctomycetota bacterium]|nr:glycosyltransferase [Planctomycetota bacterium]